jgi:hypothetical protein
MLYVFQAVPPPIIRSSKLCTQHRVFVELFLLVAACKRQEAEKAVTLHLVGYA